MENEFLFFINERLNAKQIEFRPMNRKREDWESVLARLEFEPARYLYNVVRYYNFYFAEKFSLLLDQSTIVYSNNKPVGIWPLMIAKENDRTSIAIKSFGGGVMPPQIVADYPIRASKRLQHKLLELLDSYCNRNSFDQLVLSDVFVGEIGVSEWYSQTVHKAEVTVSDHVQYLNLQRGNEYANAHIRKAYKPLISKSQKRFSTVLGTSSNSESFKIYKQLHHEVSGRITRNSTTWKAQHDLLKDNNAFCSLVFDGQKPVGAAYFIKSHDEVSYFSGAYSKDYLNESVGHLALYNAIQHAISQKIKWFRIGHIRQQASQKLNDIDFFKNGFVSHIITENTSYL